MDTERLAERVVGGSLQIKKGDRVQIYCNKQTVDLAENVALECQKLGAHAAIALSTDRMNYDAVLDRPIEYLTAPDPFGLGLLDIANITVGLGGTEDPSRLKEVTPERWTAYAKGQVAYEEKLRATKHRGATIGVGTVSPQRAKTYAFNYDAWRKNVYDALDVDYGEMAKLGTKLQSALKGSKEIHITNAAGTDLTGRIKGGPTRLDDGVLRRDQDDSLFVELPAGTLTIVPDLASVNGSFVADIDLPLFAKMVRGISWKFEKGKIVSFEGKDNIELMKDKWLEGTGDRTKFGAIGFGLNPKVKPGFLHNPFVRGAVSVCIGDNRWYGGESESSVSWAVTSVSTTVKLDDKTIIDKGKMVL
jgi:leucyl aminopeptidase (aminopeptidase T)